MSDIVVIEKDGEVILLETSKGQIGATGATGHVGAAGATGDTAATGAQGDPGGVYVSANDTTAGYLNGKLIGGVLTTLTEGNDGGNETLTIDVDITGHTGDATIHFTEGSIDHTAIANIGTNSHTVIDSHIAATAAHGVTEIVGTSDNQTLTNKSLDGANNTIIDVTSALAINLHARKASAGTIAIGSPVYIVSYNVGGGYVEVEAADASDTAKMPAVGLVSEAISNSTTGHITSNGEVIDWDTSTPGWGVGDALYVASGGGLTSTKPTGTNLIQKIAFVLRSHLSNGVVHANGPGRTNDVPNLGSGKFWRGDASGVPQMVNLVEADISDLQSYILAGGVTYEQLDTNGDVGTIAGTLAIGNHNHTGVYEPADATILKDADIGVNVQAYDATIVVDADIGVNVQAYDATILVDADIGVNVSAFAHNHTGVYQPLDTDLTNIAALTGTSGFLKTDGANIWSVDTNSYSLSSHNHTGVYEPADATIVKDSDIGVNVQAYDATIVVDADIGVSVAAESHNHTVDSLSNVVITTAADEDVLQWDTTTSKWINAAASGGAGFNTVPTTLQSTLRSYAGMPPYDSAPTGASLSDSNTKDNQYWAYPVMFLTDVTISKLSFYTGGLVAPGSNEGARIGIYTANSSTFFPEDLVYQTDEITAIAKDIEYSQTGISQTLSANTLYWFTYWGNNNSQWVWGSTNPLWTVLGRRYAANQTPIKYTCWFFAATYTYGTSSFPATFPAGATATSGTGPAISYEI